MEPTFLLGSYFCISQLRTITISVWNVHVSLLHLTEGELNLISQKLLKRKAEDNVYAEEKSMMNHPANISSASHSFDEFSFL